MGDRRSIIPIQYMYANNWLCGRMLSCVAPDGRTVWAKVVRVVDPATGKDKVVPSRSGNGRIIGIRVIREGFNGTHYLENTIETRDLRGIFHGMFAYEGSSRPHVNSLEIDGVRYTRFLKAVKKEVDTGDSTDRMAAIQDMNNGCPQRFPGSDVLYPIMFLVDS